MIRVSLRTGRAELVVDRYRRWWQFWKPRRWEETVASAPCAPVRDGDEVRLMANHDSYFATINGKPVVMVPLSEVR